MSDTEKYKGKYRIPSARLAAWDYGANAAYFVTICTAEHICYFGKITKNTAVETQDIASPPPSVSIQYTSLGLAALECWCEIPVHFPFVELGEFVVMPNHVHGVIIINKPAMENPVETQDIASRVEQDIASRVEQDIVSWPTRNVMNTQNTVGMQNAKEAQCTDVTQYTEETHDHASLRITPSQNKFGSQSKNLASIIRGFKIGVTKFARQNNLLFAWQPRYHDRVIRNNAEHERINQYILENVQNWEKDELYNY